MAYLYGKALTTTLRIPLVDLIVEGEVLTDAETFATLGVSGDDFGFFLDDALRRSHAEAGRFFKGVASPSVSESP